MHPFYRMRYRVHTRSRFRFVYRSDYGKLIHNNCCARYLFENCTIVMHVRDAIHVEFINDMQLFLNGCCANRKPSTRFYSFPFSYDICGWIKNIPIISVRYDFFFFLYFDHHLLLWSIQLLSVIRTQPTFEIEIEDLLS